MPPHAGSLEALDVAGGSATSMRMQRRGSRPGWRLLSLFLIAASVTG